MQQVNWSQAAFNACLEDKPAHNGMNYGLFSLESTKLHGKSCDMNPGCTGHSTMYQNVALNFEKQLKYSK